MTRSVDLVFLAATVCTATAFAQVISDSNATSDVTNRSPVEYVYVSSFIGNSGTTEINAYSAAE
jgi:hypothetical protein